MLWLIGLSVIGVILRFAVPLFGDIFTNLVSLVIIAWTAIVGIKSYRAGLPSSGFFLIAFAFSIVGSFILIFSLIGLLPKNDLTLFYSMPGGSMIEMVLFSFALGNKLNILRKENEDSQERIMDQLRLNEALQTKVNRELEQKVAERTIEVRAEKEKSDGLLLNILPAPIAEELKQKGVATPRAYDTVSILFTDFKGFSTKASKMSAEELVQQLDYCFRAFDEIIERNGLEKIKTIGDAYMCAGGVPIASEDHAPRTVGTGIEMQEFMVKWGEELRKMGKEPWELRIGINTGPVVAGVVGKRKFAYDIWGATVNLAARLESNGAVGRVNISRSTYDLVKNKFRCTYRGKIAAKDVGEIDMFFVDASE
jgi:class 3 adenylate cyclase